MSEFQPKQNPEGATQQRSNLPPQQAIPQIIKEESAEKEEDKGLENNFQSGHSLSSSGNPGGDTAYVSNPRQQGLQPRQIGRTMERSMNRWGNSLPSNDSTLTQEPPQTQPKYPTHQIKMKGDISTARPEAISVPEESRLSEIQELPPERVIPELQESVGKGGVNRKEEMRDNKAANFQSAKVNGTSSKNDIQTKGPGEWLQKINPFAQEEVDPEKQTHLRKEFEIYSVYKLQLIEQGHTIVPNEKASSKEELGEEFSKKRDKFLNRMENNQRSFWGTDRYARLMEKWFPDYDLVIQNKITAVKTSTGLKIQETNQTIDKLIAKIKEAISVADGDMLKAQYLLNEASCHADEALAKKQEAEKVLEEYGKDKKETTLPCYNEVIGKYQLLVGQLQQNIAGVQEDKTVFSTVLSTLNTQQTRLNSFSNKLSGINDVQQVITFTKVEFISLSESVSKSISQAQDSNRKTLSVAEEEVKNTFEQGSVDLDASDAEVASIKQKEIARREAERKRKVEEERKRKEAEKERLLKLSQDGMQKETALSSTLPTNEAEHLKTREGVRKDVYNDGVKDTITAGVGHKLTKEELKKYKEGQEISQETIDEWLKDDAERNYKRALEQAKEIGYENQLLVNALFHMCFQNGENWQTKHKKTWSYLKEQNWVAAAKEAADSTWFSQTPKRVLDFQVALLAIAGEKNDYESLREFNKDAIVKRKPNLPDLYDFQVDTKGLKTKKEKEVEDREAQKQAWAETKDELWHAYSDYENNKIDMISFGKKLEAHTRTHAHDVGLIIDKMGFTETDNLAYVILSNSSDADLKGMDEDLLTKLKDALDTLWSGAKADQLYEKQLERLKNLLEPVVLRGDVKEERSEKSTSSEKNSAKQSAHSWDYSDRAVSDKYDLKEIAKDKELVRKTFNHSLAGSVGDNGVNYPDDVRMVARQLEALGYEIEEKVLINGECSQDLIIKIKKWQVDKKLSKAGDGILSATGNDIKKLFSSSGTYDSGLDKIYANRSAINEHLKKYKSTLKGNVGADSKSKKSENYKEDVIHIASLLKLKGINVPKESLEGTSNQKFIEALKEFQKQSGITKDGNVTKGGETDKQIHGFKATYSLGMISRDINEHDSYGKGTAKDAYHEKLNFLQEQLGIKEDSDLNKVLKIAEKASSDRGYFTAFTKDVSAKMLIEDKEIEEGGIILSSLLQDRMARFHRFMVAAGLYRGDMNVSDGVRSAKRAHGFSVQYRIVTGISSASIKKNLIKMYNEGEIFEGYVEDKHGFKWAKKEWFTIKEGQSIDLDYAKVQAYVKTLDLGRSNITSPASVGFKDEKKCWPLPPGSTPSKHTEGLAMDINRHNFIAQKDTIVDLIALRFGVVRAGGAKETWHFELSDLGISAEEKRLIEQEER